MASRVLAILLAVFAVNYMDRQILAILIEPIKAELGLTDTQAGVLYGFTFALFYSTLGIPIARIADRADRVGIILGSLTLFSIMTAVSGLVVSYWQLLLARIGVAVGEAGTNPPSQSIIADLYPLPRRTRAMAIFTLGPHVGVLLSFAIGGLAAHWWGWRAAFVIAGILGLIVAILGKIWLREPSRTADVATGGASMAIVMRELWRHRSIRHIFAGAAVVSTAVAIVMGWTPAFLIRTHELDVASVGLLLALVLGVLGAFGTLAGGILADALGKTHPGARLKSVAIGLLVMTPAWAVALQSTDTRVAIVGLVTGGALVAIHVAPSYAMVQSLAPINGRALAASLLLFVANVLGVGFGPVVVGWVSDVLEPRYGAESLGIAMLFVLLPVYAWGACHYYIAGDAIARDLENNASSADHVLSA